ncbi:putative F-box domain-containing protein [Septoria linicola]|nr:putative F-box domain-containing protein [Septoria linicola]
MSLLDCLSSYGSKTTQPRGPTASQVEARDNQRAVLASEEPKSRLQCNQTGQEEPAADAAGLTISALPTEINMMIMAHLPAKDIARSSRLSRYFNSVGQVQGEHISRSVWQRNIARIQSEMSEFEAIKSHGDFLESLLRFMRFQGLAVEDAWANVAIDCQAFITYWLDGLAPASPGDRAALECAAACLLALYIREYFPEHYSHDTPAVMLTDNPNFDLDRTWFDSDEQMAASVKATLSSTPPDEEYGVDLARFEHWQVAITFKHALCLDYDSLATEPRDLTDSSGDWTNTFGILNETSQKGQGPRGAQFRAVTDDFDPMSVLSDMGEMDVHVRLHQQLNLSSELQGVYGMPAWRYGSFMPYHVYSGDAEWTTWKHLVSGPRRMTALQRLYLLESMSIKPRCTREEADAVEDDEEEEEESSDGMEE